jgi:hypothetical protein
MKNLKMLAARGYAKTAAAVSLFTLAGAANAVIDVTSATTGISDAGVALAAIIGALISMSVLVLGISYVLKFISRKSGTN